MITIHKGKCELKRDETERDEDESSSHMRRPHMRKWLHMVAETRALVSGEQKLEELLPNKNQWFCPR